jgi:hypothetical protein
VIGLLLTVDAAPECGPANSQSIFEQAQCSPLYAKGAMSELVVSIDGPAYLVIDPPSTPHVMNQAQREAMERAFWRSVDVLDDGSEG